MNIEELTKKWLTEEINKPLPQGHITKFGIQGKAESFHKYKSLEDMEQNNMEFNGKKWEVLGYNEPHYKEKKKKFLPTDEFWKINETIYVIRDNWFVLKEYVSSEKSIKKPDPDFYFELNGL